MAAQSDDALSFSLSDTSESRAARDSCDTDCDGSSSLDAAIKPPAATKLHTRSKGCDVQMSGAFGRAKEGARMLTLRYDQKRLSKSFEDLGSDLSDSSVGSEADWDAMAHNARYRVAPTTAARLSRHQTRAHTLRRDSFSLSSSAATRKPSSDSACNSSSDGRSDSSSSGDSLRRRQATISRTRRDNRRRGTASRCGTECRRWVTAAAKNDLGSLGLAGWFTRPQLRKRTTSSM